MAAPSLLNKSTVWPVGLALHGISVFVPGTGKGLRERMIQKERERLQRERGGS